MEYRRLGRVDAGIYRTSSTPDLVCFIFPTPRDRANLALRAICTFPRGGATISSPLRGLVGSWPAGSLWARFVVGYNYIASSRLSRLCSLRGFIGVL